MHKHEPIHRILCPTDFSSTSANAFQYAARLSEATGATLILLHAAEPSDAWKTGGGAHAIDETLKKKLMEISRFSVLKQAVTLSALTSWKFLCITPRLTACTAGICTFLPKKSECKQKNK